MSRAYFFGNMYLSQIQQGIQAGHVISELFTKYYSEYSCDEEVLLYEWANDHKTMILLNGGHGSNLHDLIDFFEQDDNPYPFSFFKESEGALDNALTCVGIILPEKIYEGAAVLRKRFSVEESATFIRDKGLYINGEYIKYTEWEIELMNRLTKFRLA